MESKMPLPPAAADGESCSLQGHTGTVFAAVQAMQLMVHSHSSLNRAASASVKLTVVADPGWALVGPEAVRIYVVAGAVGAKYPPTHPAGRKGVMQSCRAAVQAASVEMASSGRQSTAFTHAALAGPKSAALQTKGWHADPHLQ